MLTCEFLTSLDLYLSISAWMDDSDMMMRLCILSAVFWLFLDADWCQSDLETHLNWCRISVVGRCGFSFIKNNLLVSVGIDSFWEVIVSLFIDCRGMLSIVFETKFVLSDDRWELLIDSWHLVVMIVESVIACNWIRVSVFEATENSRFDLILYPTIRNQVVSETYTERYSVLFESVQLDQKELLWALNVRCTPIFFQCHFVVRFACSLTCEHRGKKIKKIHKKGSQQE